MWELNKSDERVTAGRNTIRARYWLWLQLTLALVLAIKAVLACLTELPRLTLLPEAVTLAAGLLIPLTICAAKRVKFPLDEPQHEQVHAVLAWVYCGMSVALLVTDFVLIFYAGELGVYNLILMAVMVGVIWDRCETALFRAGLILWGGNERRRRGKKRLTLRMIALAAVLIIAYTTMRMYEFESWEQYWLSGDNDLLLVTIWICAALAVWHGRIVSRRDQGDNIADKLEMKAMQAVEASDEE